MATLKRLCLLIPPLLFLTVSARSPDLPSLGQVGPGTLFGRQDAGSAPSACRPPCDMDTCGAAVCGVAGSALAKRGDKPYANLTQEDMQDLRKRLFTLTPGSTDINDRVRLSRGQADFRITNYLLEVCYNQAEMAYFGPTLPTVQLGPNGGVSDERPFSQQIVFGDQPFQISSIGVHGCTVIILVSRRAVWMAHLWESYSNGKNATGHNYVEANDPAFKQRVLDFITGTPVTDAIPNGYRPYITPTAPSIDPTLFDAGDRHTRLYVFTPIREDADPANPDAIENWKYGARYGKNGEFHRAVAAHLGDSPRYIGKGYVPVNTDNEEQADLLGTTHHGIVLFQYDPDSDGKGKGKKTWRLFQEKDFFPIDI